MVVPRVYIDTHGSSRFHGASCSTKISATQPIVDELTELSTFVGMLCVV